MRAKTSRHRQGLPWIFPAMLVALLTCGGRLAAQMPSPRYTPDIDLTDAAYVRAVARLADGKLVVGGNNLARVNGTGRAYLARLNTDGSLDSSWNPAPNGGVGALWVDATGMLYVGGFFSMIDGQPRAGLARFNAAGVLDPNWMPTQNGGVGAIAPGLAGTLCFGGTFTQVNSATHNRLACVSDVDGSLLAGFVPDVNSTVTTLVTSGNNLYVGGYFTNISSVGRSFAARLPLNGNGSPDSWNPAPNNVVLAFLPTTSGAVYLAGFFNYFATTTQSGIVKVNDTTGTLVAGWNAQTTFQDFVLDLCSDGSGGVIVAGTFSAIGGQSRLNVARLDGSTGNAIAGFDPGIDYGYPTHVLAEPSGNYLVAGPFSSMGGGEHLALGRVLASGSVDATFDPSLEAQGYAYVVARLPAAGAFVIGGRFVRADGLIRRNLIKLSPPGRVDPNWIANTDSEVRALAVDDVGRIYVSGYFTRVGSFNRPYLARLQNTTDGAVDPSWNPQPNAAIYPVLLRNEGLYVSGFFSTIGGGSQTYLARLSTSNGNLDAGWKPVVDGYVGGLAATTSGDLLVAGSFSSVNAVARSGAAKLATAASATLDTAWAPALAGGSGGAIAVDNDDVYLSGSFTSVNGTPRTRLARVSASGAGALDTAWAPSVDNSVTKLLVQPEGIYIAGFFANVNNSGHGYLARVDAATGALDPSWVSAANTWVLDLLAYRESIFCVGWFTSIGGAARQAAARLPVAGDTIFVDDFDG